MSLAKQYILVRQAKKDGVQVTAEVCPHHVVFTEDDLWRLGAYGRMKPPLASKIDVAALWMGIEDGTIDCIATDHAPHTEKEKENFTEETGPFGVIGQGAFSVMWTAFLKRGLPRRLLMKLMRENPRKILGLPEDDKDSFMRVDLGQYINLFPHDIVSKAGRSPYEHWNDIIRGRIVEVYLHGVQVVKNGELIKDSKPGVLV